ncbi:eclosion hormone-like [Paramacrobiotus metropolitanus]|uniref:eclosion hormone-like n=1 Tax=Paramacrobiotus metropolitanus TaxID=2943436 RepID=UPI002445745F|nr:eclosion hormone-like [Paramacrobiotus metropolitanus]XP_055345616.1 eclosion hormone-like [Paramacrobiotus metropolitanus]XP_055345617.1 eclosion hormone-like [Paramacrobiotus metropolitanus]
MLMQAPSFSFSSLTMAFLTAILLMRLAAPAPLPATTKNAAATALTGNLLSICITNCAQCHDLVGDIFDHRKCSRDCIQKRGTFLPDCTNPSSIRDYLMLKKLAVLNTDR